MKSDIPKVSPRQEKPQAQDSVMSGGWSGNNNGHRTNERSRVCNEGKAEGSGKPTVSLRKVESNRAGIPKSPLDQKQRRGRREFREMLSGTGSSRNSC